jgi:DNA-binding XRE family transcriptional regulator
MKFQETFCSQCGQGFGPGDGGYSSCKSHTPKHQHNWAAYSRMARGALGLSQSEVAQAVGVTRATIVRLETGRSPIKALLVNTLIDFYTSQGVSSNIQKHPSLLSGQYVTVGIYLNSIGRKVFVSPLKANPLRGKK